MGGWREKNWWPPCTPAICLLQLQLSADGSCSSSPPSTALFIYPRPLIVNTGYSNIVMKNELLLLLIFFTGQWGEGGALFRASQTNTNVGRAAMTRQQAEEATCLSKRSPQAISVIMQDKHIPHQAVEGAQLT